MSFGGGQEVGLLEHIALLCISCNSGSPSRREPRKQNVGRRSHTATIVIFRRQAAVTRSARRFVLSTVLQQFVHFLPCQSDNGIKTTLYSFVLQRFHRLLLNSTAFPRASRSSSIEIIFASRLLSVVTRAEKNKKFNFQDENFRLNQIFRRMAS